MLCQYCRTEAVLLKRGEAGYPHFADYGPLHVCAPCRAWVQCKPGTTEAAGELADVELQKWRLIVTGAMSPLWRRKMERDGCDIVAARKAGYLWLGAKLGIDIPDDVNAMDLEQCKLVTRLCQEQRKK